MPKISEIAKAAGVSPAVISRVANGDSSLRIREETRQRVLDAIRSHEYAPNFAARTLRSSESGLLALVVHDNSNPVYSEIFAGAQRAADSLNKSVILGEARDTGEGLGRIAELIAGGGVDGLILQGAGTESDRVLLRAARRWMPTVLLQSGAARRGTTLIRLEDESAGESATNCLIELGHRKIGCLGVTDGLAFSDDRRKGWESALRKKGIAFAPNWYAAAGWSFAGGASAVEELIRNAPSLTALVIANVTAAVGAVARLTELKIRIPDDVSLVALHDTAVAQYVRPALTVVKMPLRELGAAAVAVCCNNHASASREIVVADPSPKVVWRASAAGVKPQ